MPQAYLLRCPKCGRQHTVTTSQAGDELRCDCQAMVHVPTLRGLRELPPSGEAELQKPIWGLRQGLWFLGAVLLLSGLAFTSVLYLQQESLREPVVEHTNEKSFHDEIEQYSLNQTWSLWLFLSHNGIATPDTPQERAVNDGIRALHKKMVWGLIVAGLGLFIGGCGFFVKPSKPRA